MTKYEMLHFVIGKYADAAWEEDEMEAMIAYIADIRDVLEDASLLALEYCYLQQLDGLPYPRDRREPFAMNVQGIHTMN